MQASPPRVALGAHSVCPYTQDIASLPMTPERVLGFVSFPTPGTCAVGGTSQRSVSVEAVMPDPENGIIATRVEATSGTVTLTRVDSTELDGSADLTFGSSGQVSGSSTAPVCNAPDAGTTDGG